MEANERLREIRERLRLSPAEAAERTGLPRMALFDLEAYPEEAEKVATLDGLFHVCRGYGIRPAEIFQDAAKGSEGQKGEPERLAQALKDLAAQEGKSLSELDEELDFFIEPLVRNPMLYYECGVEHLRTTCAMVGWDWLACLEHWFDRWQNAEGARDPK